ncbi:MAG: hypothetical protein ACPLSJ_01485 [Thermosulfidibacteraceae bacterium]|jgi:predicted regulator of Ras-like GTPase activity (Roadblock/LC7/MglB family)
MIDSRRKLEEIINEWINKNRQVKVVVFYSLDGLPEMMLCKEGEGKEVDAEKLSSLGATLLFISSTLRREINNSKELREIKTEYGNSKINIVQLTEDERVLIIEETNGI